MNRFHAMGRVFRRSWPRTNAATSHVSTALQACLVLLGVACRPTSEEERPLSKPTLLELDLRQSFGERGHSFLGEHQPGLARAVERVTDLGQDAQSRGLFVRLGELSGRWSDAEEWARVFDALRARMKPVHCSFETLDNAGYALAAHCDTLSMTPAGTLDVVGLSAQALYGKRLLDTVGVRAELLQVGRYKGAAEPFTLESMSAPLRESLDHLLDDLDARFRAHLKVRSTLASADLQALIDRAPYHADGARAAKLVDAVAYDDEARHKAKLAVLAQEVRPIFPHDGKHTLSLRKVIDALSEEESETLEAQDRVVMATLEGEIVDGDGAGADGAASEPFVAAMRRFANDYHVRAVVLRIESPGGSAMASDRMWHAVRGLARRKPVIVSMGDMAASGGYYVACAGTHILATEGSIVGSIGVVGGKMVVSDLADRIGVHADTLRRGEHATWLSPLAPFSEGERRRLEQLLRNTYDMFLDRVATGRKRTRAQLRDAVEGRVMGGVRATELGLVDEMGGVARALELARERSRLPKRAPVEVWPSDSTPLDAIAGALVGASLNTPALRWLGDLSRTGARLGAQGSWLTRVEPGRPLAVLPAQVIVR